MQKFWYQLVLILAFASALSAQKTPKLGLVLSGGGAKGMAHIGVIKAMEEAGLRPDYIAGTSMGAIVGGLYALGYSAHEIDSIIRRVDWDQVLSNSVPLNYIAFEEKEYYDRYLLGFPIKGYTIQIGSGLIRGQMLSEIMHYNLWPAVKYESFDDFPIPFRCLATNVGAGESVIFSEGSLPAALRASMAIPTAFTAIDRDSTLLVDGGVLNNFPAEVVKAMGADYIIGVNVGTNLQKDLPRSMPDILMSLSMIPSTQKLDGQMQLCNIYIEPPLDNYNAASFLDAEEILRIGDSTGQHYKGAFEQLAKQIGMQRQPFSMGEINTVLKIDSIDIRGNTIFSDDLILRKLNISIEQFITRDDLELGIRRVYGINGFLNIDYEIINHNGKNTLRLKMKEKSQSNIFASLHADNIFSAGITLNYTTRELLGSESRSIFALDISRNPRFRFDYYKYLRQNKRLAFNFRYDYGALQLPTYEEGVLSDISISYTHRLSANFLTTQSLKESYGVGIFFESSLSRLRVGNNVNEGLRGSTQRNYGLRFTHTSNDLNDRNFPTKGGESLVILNSYLGTNLSVRLNEGVDSVALEILGSSGVVTLSEAQLNELADFYNPGFYSDIMWTIRKYKSLRTNWQLNPYAAFGLSLGLGEENAIVRNFRLGGMQRVDIRDIRVLGLQFGEITTSNFGLVGMQSQHLIGKNLFVRAGINGLAYNNYLPLDEWALMLGGERSNNFNLLLGMGLETTLRTFFGPISVGLSTNNIDWQLRYYVGLGFSFNYSD